MSDNEPILIFFRNRPSNLLARPPLASSMQSLETVFILLSQFRYPHALVSINSAIEGAIKSFPNRKKKKGNDFKSLLNTVPPSASKNIADFPDELAKELRKARNDIAHYGFSPKDDNKSIDLIFRIGLPLLEICYKDLHQINLRHSLHQKISDWLGISRQIWEAANKIAPDDKKYLLRGFQFVIRRELSDDFISDAEFHAINQYSDVLYDHIEERKQQIEREWSAYWEIDCPVCGGNELLFVKLDFGDTDTSPLAAEKALCASCDFYIEPQSIEPFHSEIVLNPLLAALDQKKIRREYGM